MLNRTQRTLCRLLMRYPARMNAYGITRLDIQPDIDPNAWLSHGGAHAWDVPPPAYNQRALAARLPWLDEKLIGNGSFSSAELRHVIRKIFREPTEDIDDALVTDRAFEALRVLSEQLHLARSSSTAQTEGVRVDVSTGFVGTSEELDPAYDGSYPPKDFFTYHVRVSNMGDQVVQLISRHWIIKNASGDVVAEVAKGARGVVGCTPILKRGQSFSYYSGTDLEDLVREEEQHETSDNSISVSEAVQDQRNSAVDDRTVPPPYQGQMSDGFRYCGSMEGSFEMAVLDGRGQPVKTFDAEIARFQMWKPVGRISIRSRKEAQ